MVELPPEATDPEFRSIFEYWHSRAPAGRLPGRQHIDPCEIPPALLPWIMLIDVLPQPRGRRFRYRLTGTRVTDLFATEVTGRFMDDVVAREWHALIFDSLNFACDCKQPSYLRAQVSIRHRDYVGAKRLALPLARDGETVDMLLCLVLPVLGNRQ